MPSSEQGQHHRVGIKSNPGGSSSSSYRQSLTKKRNELSNKIRKAKRSQLIATKRRLTAPAVATTIGAETASTIGTETSSSLQELVVAYVKEPCDENVMRLQSTLALRSTTVSSVNALLLVPGISGVADTWLSTELTGKLVEQLILSSTSVTVTVTVTPLHVLHALRILTNLAAGEASQVGSGSSGDDYYGGPHWRPEDVGWCGVLLHMNCVSVLGKVLEHRGAGIESQDEVWLRICTQCCWAVGNIAGDSQHARQLATDGGVLRPLLACLYQSFQTNKTLNQQQQQQVITVQYTELCRNAAWALCNLLRGPDVSAVSFLETNIMTPNDWAGLLLSMELQTTNNTHQLSINKGSDIEDTNPTATWMEVSLESCWIAAYLTAKEDRAVNFLLKQDQPDSPHTNFCGAIAHRLHQAATTIQHTVLTSNTHPLNKHNLMTNRICIPCIRTVGNIATSSNGQHMVALLANKTYLNCPSIPQSLSIILQTASQAPSTGDINTIATEAAWAAGTLLCDAGFPIPHPSTAAAHILVPVLCKLVANGSNNLDLKREALSALWNAAACPPTPPTSDIHAARNVDVDTQELRNYILTGMANTNNFVSALVDLVLLPDVDAMYLSLRLMDAMLRRLTCRDAIQRMLEEAGGLDVLESVCDRASASSNLGQNKWGAQMEDLGRKSADIAADLIDDFFEEEYMGDDF